MATSTIFANIVIKDAETAERFVNALEESERDCLVNKKPFVSPYPVLTDLDKIRRLVSKRRDKKNNLVNLTRL